MLLINHAEALLSKHTVHKSAGWLAASRRTTSFLKLVHTMTSCLIRSPPADSLTNNINWSCRSRCNRNQPAGPERAAGCCCPACYTAPHAWDASLRTLCSSAMHT